MLKRTLIILFIISMAFNIAFVSTFLYHRVRMRPGFPEHFPPDHQPPPHPEFMERVEENKEMILPLRMEFQKSREELIAALMSEDFNEDELIKMVEKTLEDQIKMEKELGMRLIELRKQMTPEQAENFFSRRHFQPLGQQPPKFPQKFLKNRRKE